MWLLTCCISQLLIYNVISDGWVDCFRYIQGLGVSSKQTSESLQVAIDFVFLRPEKLRILVSSGKITSEVSRKSQGYQCTCV